MCMNDVQPRAGLHEVLSKKLNERFHVTELGREMSGEGSLAHIDS